MIMIMSPWWSPCHVEMSQGHVPKNDRCTRNVGTIRFKSFMMEKRLVDDYDKGGDDDDWLLLSVSKCEC